MSDFDQQIIEEFRAHGGHVETMGFGDSLVILHTTGARSGEARVSPVLAIPQGGGGWLVAASKAGAPESPGWYHNLVAHPEARVESGTATVDVVATEVGTEGYDAAWAQFTSRSEAFDQYAEKAGDRHIPVVLLTPR